MTVNQLRSKNVNTCLFLVDYNGGTKWSQLPLIGRAAASDALLCLLSRLRCPRSCLGIPSTLLKVRIFHYFFFI